MPPGLPEPTPVGLTAWLRSPAPLVGGVLGVDIVGLLTGLSQLPILSMALVLCLAPLLWLPGRPKAGCSLTARRAARERIVRWALIGLPFRFAGILGASCLVYCLLKERLGIGFWLAIIVFYQLGLMMHVAECRAILLERAGVPGGFQDEC
jgi:hypothetical protein